MISATPSISRPSWMRRTKPLVALRLNGSEFSQAYRCFFDDLAAGIHPIIAAGRGSRWENWVNARLAHQAIALQEANLTINLADLLQLPENTLGGAYARHMIRQGFDPQEFVI